MLTKTTGSYERSVTRFLKKLRWRGELQGYADLGSQAGQCCVVESTHTFNSSSGNEGHGLIIAHNLATLASAEHSDFKKCAIWET